MKKFVDSYCNYLKKKGIIVSDEQLEICAYGLELDLFRYACLQVDIMRIII